MEDCCELADGCEVTYDLLRAVYEGKLERTRELINTFGLSYSKEWSDGYVLLCEALYGKHILIARLLLDCGCKVNQDKFVETPLHIAARIGNENIVKLLLENGAKADLRDIRGSTALHTAAKYKQEGIVNLLISYKADVNAQDKDGNTPLHMAARYSNEKILNVLIRYKANINTQDKYGNTPLHLAAAYHVQKKIVELLVENGAKADLRDIQGRTALHCACDRFNYEIENIAVLLEFGSDINITCQNGHTPLGLILTNVFMTTDIALIQLYVSHIAKMKLANLYVSEKNLLLANEAKNKYMIRRGNFDESEFQDQCVRELERMKNEKICDCTISFYDILTKGEQSLKAYMRNENAVKVLKSTSYGIEFPLYAGILKSHLRKGIERKELLELGLGSLYSLFNNLTDLPYGCTEKILSYLSNRDLENLIDVFKSHCIS